MEVTLRCNLRRLRESKGYSQKQLAEIVGINRGNISKYENNEAYMNVITMARFAAVLGCTLDDLYDYVTSAGEV
ncbi:helix-turn-helix transcriptional regulator [Lederbergia citri]|uniref:Helix-turn-helix transcriptional regulator n=1 Tax=Lederbergia citri TaxID=2833580 RepID=A0A942YH42_9BACI|nr:helix-turn-helix transcriptional regulator [Lederbergia citri]MBS4195379.1 helix-turn-helix transcriptional regulator [Lederbergia citri]